MIKTQGKDLKRIQKKLVQNFKNINISILEKYRMGNYLKIYNYWLKCRLCCKQQAIKSDGTGVA